MGMDNVVPGEDCEKSVYLSLKVSTPACKAARSTKRSLIKRKTGRIVFDTLSSVSLTLERSNFHSC